MELGGSRDSSRQQVKFQGTMVTDPHAIGLHHTPGFLVLNSEVRYNQETSGFGWQRKDSAAGRRSNGWEPWQPRPPQPNVGGKEKLTKSFAERQNCKNSGMMLVSTCPLEECLRSNNGHCPHSLP